MSCSTFFLCYVRPFFFVMFDLFSLLCSAFFLCYVRPFFFVMFGLFSLLCSAFFSMSCLGLSRTSPLQIPVLPSFKSSSDKRSAFRGSLDCRVKPDNDSIIFSSVIPERFPVIFGLEPDISFTDSRASFLYVIPGQAQRVPGISGLSGQARQ